MQDLKTRSSDVEIMDDLDSSGEVLEQALRELEFINKWLGGNAVTMNALNLLFRNLSTESVYTIADLGCGGGDMARHIVEWADKKGFNVLVTGIDANPNVVRYAQTNLKDLTSVKFERLNIFSEDFRRLKFDVVIGTLFYHHFTRDQLISLFTQFREQVRIGFIINDIHRHPLAFHSIKYLTGLFSKSSMVVNDAPLSVRRAFSKEEIEDILKNAGYSNFLISWKWAFRWEVVVRMTK
jgi:2-polyprenyl-3-methyl-5-hydroxy-6-metoxy-1,4-benzoquinol methylase